MDIEFYDTLFTLCVSVNDEILKKEENESITFIDHFIFQMTSYVISLIHCIVTRNEKSLTRAFICRCLIEIVAILKMYLNNEISQESEELLKSYNYLCEYNVYKKYKEVLDGKEYDFNQIETNFRNVKSKYRDQMNEKNSKEFNSLLKSRLPFLFQDYSFDELIKKYCPDLYQYYAILSVLLHPNDLYISYPLFEELDFSQLENLMFGYVGIIISVFYKNGGECSKTLKSEIYHIGTNEFNNFYLNCVTKQKEALFIFAELVEKNYGENSTSYILKEVGRGLESIAIDKTFGFSEIVKCKIKPIIEMIAMLHYMEKIPHCEDEKYFADIISKHTRYKILKVYEENVEQVLNDAYELWNEKIEKIEFNDFLSKFNRPLGFIPGGSSINKFVYDLIDDIEKDELFNAHIKMIYDESQLLSHANGYMINSNTGAFMEYSSVIVSLDTIVLYELNYYIAYLKLYNETEGEHKFTKLIYDMNKQAKIFKKMSSAKNELDYKLKDFKVPY